MKQTIIKCAIALCLFACTVSLNAQNERDFAYHFIETADKNELVVKTISPQMMERMLGLQEIQENDTLQTLLRQLKSIRVVSAKQHAGKNFDTVEELAKRNHKRYTCKYITPQKLMLTRMRHKKIVELVLASQENERLLLIDLTGNMNEDFIDFITHYPASDN